MNPYRDLPLQTIETKGKPRSKIKTMWLKFLIRVKGTWKQRYYRCDRCLVCFQLRRGDHIDMRPWFHSLEHITTDLKLKQQEDKKDY